MMPKALFSFCYYVATFCYHVEQCIGYAPMIHKMSLFETPSLIRYLFEQTVRTYQSMVPYFSQHGAKQYIKNKPIKFGYMMWIVVTCQGNCIHFNPYLGLGTNLDSVFGIRGSVVSSLAVILPQDYGSYHIVTDNFFTSLPLLCHLKENNIFASGTIRASRHKNASLKEAKVMEKNNRDTRDLVTDTSSNIAVVKWKNSKVVTLLSTYCGVAPIGKAKRSSPSQKKKIDVPQPKIVKVFNKEMGVVYCMDQNLPVYMVNHRS